MINEYRFNSELRVIESIPYDPKQTLAPTIENLKLIRDDNAKFYVDSTDVSETLYRRVDKLYQNPDRHKEEVSWQTLRLLAFNKINRSKEHPPALMKKSFQMIRDGISYENVSEALNVPVATLKHWSYKLKLNNAKNNNGHRVFTPEQREEMRIFVEKNRHKMTQAEIAKTLGISISYIYYLKNPEKMAAVWKDNAFKKKEDTPMNTALKADSIPSMPETKELFVPAKHTCRQCEDLKKELNRLQDSLEQYKGIEKQQNDDYHEQQAEFKKLEASHKVTVDELKSEIQFFKNLVTKVLK